jgi:hypothetical protein
MSDPHPRPWRAAKVADDDPEQERIWGLAGDAVAELRALVPDRCPVCSEVFGVHTGTCTIADVLRRAEEMGL